MSKALHGVAETSLEEPDGLVRVRIDPETGSPAAAGAPDAIFEVFRAEYAPSWRGPAGQSMPDALAGGDSGSTKVTEQLF